MYLDDSKAFMTEAQEMNCFSMSLKYVILQDWCVTTNFGRNSAAKLFEITEIGAFAVG